VFVFKERSRRIERCGVRFSGTDTAASKGAVFVFEELPGRVRGVLYWRSIVKRILLYGLAGGILIAALRLLEFQYFVHSYPGEVYGGLIAVLFTVIGGYAGLQWTKRKEVVVIREVLVRDEDPFVPDQERLRETGLTPREFEILRLIAEGHSNREIAEKLFVSENTVKTHSSRVFDKLGVSRRVQAVQKARQLRLIP
jgi:DNA-binding CsgD family transcriptional regulator